MNIAIEPLDANNWLKVCGLSVSQEQKPLFPIGNAYWIGISRYEEGTELLAITRDGEYAGLVGCGLDEDGLSGFINPLMVDERFQRKGVARAALLLVMERLARKYHVPRIHIRHRKENNAAARLYESLGFTLDSETETENLRSYPVERRVQILSLRECPERAGECAAFLLEHFNAFVSGYPADILAGDGPLPQGYLLLKGGKVIGWTGLHEKDAVSGKVYGWEGSIQKEEVTSDGLSPWITPLVVRPDERGNRYGRLLLEQARKEAGRLGFQLVYLTTGEIGYYEKYGFREVGLTAFTWGRPTKVYEAGVL